MVEIADEQLREMAQHRGLKLVKSRRRKSGVGDYGKYGLTDAAGKALLGIGEDGLTASAADIQDYLRTSALSTWQQSAKTTPGRPAAPKKPRASMPDDEDAPARGKSAPGARKSETKAQPKSALRLIPKAGPEQAREPAAEPVAEPVLRVRAATIADADALSALLSQLGGIFSIDRDEVAANLTAARKAKARMVVAELDEIVGCCGWAVVPTVHRGAIGRLTVIVVDKAHRRRGAGTAMLAAARKALAKAGCRQVEAMSDITINNSHNFFRSLKFEQTSYRFVRSVDE
jgi:N-acetylglutamate synthase-like GNAT family acetyltransferase